MIRVDVKQGTEEWKAARLGIPSASSFDKIITPKKGDPSKTMHDYACKLLAEQMLGRPLDDASSGFMERGKELEEQARAWYAFNADVDVEQVGFILRDDGRVGCSPDGLVGDDGLVEIKCPSAAVHVSYLLGDAFESYKCQLQGQLWISERKWVDFVSFNPELPTLCVRFERDEAFIAKLSSAVDMLLAFMDASRTRLQEMNGDVLVAV